MPLSTIEEAQAREANIVKQTRRKQLLSRIFGSFLGFCIVGLIILLLASFIGCIVSIMDSGHYKWMGIMLIIHVCVMIFYGILSYFSQDMVGSRYVWFPGLRKALF